MYNASEVAAAHARSAVGITLRSHRMFMHVYENVSALQVGGVGAGAAAH